MANSGLENTRPRLETTCPTTSRTREARISLTSTQHLTRYILLILLYSDATRSGMRVSITRIISNISTRRDLPRQGDRERERSLPVIRSSRMCANYVRARACRPAAGLFRAVTLSTGGKMEKLAALKYTDKDGSIRLYAALHERERERESHTSIFVVTNYRRNRINVKHPSRETFGRAKTSRGQKSECCRRINWFFAMPLRHHRSINLRGERNGRSATEGRTLRMERNVVHWMGANRARFSSKTPADAGIFVVILYLGTE